MNAFLQSSIKLISRSGVDVTFISTGVSTYNVETGKNQTIDSQFTVKSYPKQIVATQYFYPDLIGKDSILFYLANNQLGFVPKAGDSILYKSMKYRVQSIQETVAHGDIVLYRLLTVKG